MTEKEKRGKKGGGPLPSAPTRKSKPPAAISKKAGDATHDTTVQAIGERLRAKSRPSSAPPPGGARPSSPPVARKGTKPPPQRATNHDELELIDAQVRAAESEFDAAKARADSARLQAERAQSRIEVLNEQLEAARAQTDAAMGQAQAAEAQKDAAMVQAEAAVAHVEAIREQAETVRSQLMVMKAQTETLEDHSDHALAQVAQMRAHSELLEKQITAMKRQARNTSLIGWWAALTVVALLALVGVAVYGLLNVPSRESIESVADRVGVAAAKAAGPDMGALTKQIEESVAPLETEQEQTKRVLGSLESGLGGIADRLTSRNVGAPSTRIHVTSPALDGEDLSWSTSPLSDWLAAPRSGGDTAAAYEISGTAKAPVRRGARITVDAFSSGHWWPVSTIRDVGDDGTWSGSIQLDSTSPPEKLRVTLREGIKLASKVYTFGSKAAD